MIKLLRAFPTSGRQMQGRSTKVPEHFESFVCKPGRNFIGCGEVCAKSDASMCFSKRRQITKSNVDFRRVPISGEGYGCEMLRRSRTKSPKLLKELIFEKKKECVLVVQRYKRSLDFSPQPSFCPVFDYSSHRKNWTTRVSLNCFFFPDTNFGRRSRHFQTLPPIQRHSHALPQFWNERRVVPLQHLDRDPH